MKNCLDLANPAFAGLRPGAPLEGDGTARLSLETAAGKPSGLARGKAIPLSRGQLAAVDADFAEQAGRVPWRWRSRAGKPQAYCLVSSGPGLPGREVLMHHLVLGLCNGEVVIHRNHNGLDNRRANLCVATKSEVAAHAATRGNAPGVWHDPADGLWHAEVIGVDGVVDLGAFDTNTAASEAVRRARPRRELPPMPPVECHTTALATQQPAPRAPTPRPLPPHRQMRAPRNKTGVAGVTHDEKNRRFVVRVGRITRSFMSLAAATSAAGDLITAFGQGNRDVGPREVITKLGGFEVLLDAEVANWLWSTGKWTVRRRSDRALEIRRQRVSDGHPDAEYLTAPRYIYGAGPGERVVFVNGDQLDLRVANLRLEPVQQKAPAAPKVPKERPKISEEYKLVREIGRQMVLRTRRAARKPPSTDQ